MGTALITMRGEFEISLFYRKFGVAVRKKNIYQNGDYDLGIKTETISGVLQRITHGPTSPWVI